MSNKIQREEAAWRTYPDEVIGSFHFTGLSSRTSALGLTQHLVEISARDLHGFKGGRCVRLTTSLPSVSQLSRKWNLDTLQSSWPPLPGARVPLPFLPFTTESIILQEDWN
jgi:hypothetical protein